MKSYSIKQEEEGRNANLALLQWRVVDVAGQCGLITIARRTRQTSSDKSATASNADRYAQFLNQCLWIKLKKL